MEISKKIIFLKNSIKETADLVDELMLIAKGAKNKIKNKEMLIIDLKEEVKLNIEKIDEIIEDYNGNS